MAFMDFASTIDFDFASTTDIDLVIQSTDIDFSSTADNDGGYSPHSNFLDMKHISPYMVILLVFIGMCLWALILWAVVKWRRNAASGYSRVEMEVTDAEHYSEAMEALNQEAI